MPHSSKIPYLLTGTGGNIKCILNIILERGRMQLSVEHQGLEMVEDIQHLIGFGVIWAPEFRNNY